MSKEAYEAVMFALANAKSYDGILNCKVVYDHLMGKSWLLDCGELSLMLSSQEVAIEVIAGLNQA